MRELVTTKITKLMNGMKSLLPKKSLKLENLIEITESDNLVTVEIKKDMFLKIDGNILSLVSGINVSLAKEIHLNPKVPASMDELEKNIEDYKREQMKLLSESNHDCKCQDKKGKL